MKHTHIQKQCSVLINWQEYCEQKPNIKNSTLQRSILCDSVWWSTLSVWQNLGSPRIQTLHTAVMVLLDKVGWSGKTQPACGQPHLMHRSPTVYRKGKAKRALTFFSIYFLTTNHSRARTVRFPPWLRWYPWTVSQSETFLSFFFLNILLPGIWSQQWEKELV